MILHKQLQACFSKYSGKGGQGPIIRCWLEQIVHFLSALSFIKQVFYLGSGLGRIGGHLRDTCCQKTSYSFVKSFSPSVWIELFCARSSYRCYALGLPGWPAPTNTGGGPHAAVWVGMDNFHNHPSLTGSPQDRREHCVRCANSGSRKPVPDTLSMPPWVQKRMWKHFLKGHVMTGAHVGLWLNHLPLHSHSTDMEKHFRGTSGHRAIPRTVARTVPSLGLPVHPRSVSVSKRDLEKISTDTYDKQARLCPGPRTTSWHPYAVLCTETTWKHFPQMTRAHAWPWLGHLMRLPGHFRPVSTIY